MSTLFDPLHARDESWKVVRAAGYRVNPDLPLLDEPAALRPADQVADRMLCLHAILARSFGFSSKKANEWIDQEGLRPHLSATESDFLRGDTRLLLAVQVRVNGLYGLAWSSGLIERFDCLARIPDQLVQLFPELLRMEVSDSFRRRLALRPMPVVLAACDLAYCFHWALTDAAMQETLQAQHSPALVSERRRALEWLIAIDEDWETVPLDT